MCCGVFAASASAATSYRWAKPSMNYTRSHHIIGASTLRRGPGAKMTRRAWVRSLVALDAWRASHYGTPNQMASAANGPALPDAGPSSIYSKAIGLGWIRPIKGRFNGGTPITGDEAARGAVGAMGKRQSATLFSRQLKAQLPGLRTNFYLRAAQVYVRALGMRYNHLQGSERLEFGPHDPLRISHAAYMLHHGAIAESWRVDQLAQYETFDLPTLHANQRRVLNLGTKLIGNPYIWAGETEKMQPEGHGGFDCSGFVWRTVVNGSVPSRQRVSLPQRTSYGMSNVSRSRRIYKIANLRPGDLMFWGNRGPKSRPGENYHVGIYMGNRWFIHSTGGNDGPSIQRIDGGYWEDQFSWGRRVLKRY
jgi:hypothetical protein